MINWMHQCADLIEQHTTVVMVTVVQTRGSTPREVGTKFFVIPTGIVGTIGGGNLEHQATKIAESLLSDNQSQPPLIKHFSLAAGLGMCCGGVVELMFEVLNSNDLVWLNLWLKCEQKQHKALLITHINAKNSNKNIYFADELLSNVCELPESIKNAAKQQFNEDKKQTLIKTNDELFYLESIADKAEHLYLFGAGHVGQAIVTLMSELPWEITWVDTRDNILSAKAMDQLPHQVTYCLTDSPEAEVSLAKANSYFLIMTHDHALDLVLCEEVLKRGDAQYFGVIGSKTKRQRFEHRLIAKGFSKKQLNNMVCPIGIKGIKSKQAAAIAVSVVAQLLQQKENNSDRNLLKETA